MAQDVVARLDVLGDLDQPAVAVGNELVVSPLTRRGGAVDEAHAVDLEELQTGLVDSRAVTVARGQVVNDGALKSC